MYVWPGLKWSKNYNLQKKKKKMKDKKQKNKNEIKNMYMSLI